MQMKNQYRGDIGDYGKYGLLRYLRDQGIRIGVNWYLTPGDGKSDGIHTEYLDDRRMRCYDPELFDTLGGIVHKHNKDISLIEESGLLSGLRFYHTMMDFDSFPWRKRATERAHWHQQAMDALNTADLVFADPDNGLPARIRQTMKNAQKYVLPCEIEGYFNRGQQIVYYHHRSRKPEAGWMRDKMQIRAFLPEAKLLGVSFNRWSCRTFIFVLHEAVYERYNRTIESFLNSMWGTYQVGNKSAFVLEEIRVP